MKTKQRRRLMADWSLLPKEPLLQISDSLRSAIDVHLFRSVCSAWRSTLQPKPRSLPDSFPIIPYGGISSSFWGFRLFKRTIYRIGNDWIVKIAEVVSDIVRLLNPLSGERFKQPMPWNLDFLNIRVGEVEEEYVIHLFDKWPYSNWFGKGSSLYDEKVVFNYDRSGDINSSLLSADAAGFILLTISVSGRLAVFKSGGKKWKVIKEMLSPYVDVKLYKGKFYAVDSSGRIVMVESASRIPLVADSVFEWDVKRLVESCRDLLLVDMWFNVDDRPADFQAAEVAVYHLHSSKIEFLTVESKYWNLFWPTPASVIR